MQNHNNAPATTAPTALPTPIPILACVCNSGLESVGEFEELIPPSGASLDEFGVRVVVGELAGGSVVMYTVLTTPPLLVVRDGELVRAGVELLVEVGLVAVVVVALDGDRPC